MIGKGRAIRQFMWAYQPHFRTSATNGAGEALKAIGLAGDPKIVLVGFKVAGDHEFDVCVEPEDGPYSPTDFVNIEARTEELYRSNFESTIRHSVAHLHDAKQRALRDEMRAEAVAEVLHNHPVNENRTFFASRSTQVGDYEVHVVLGVVTNALAAVPRLRTTLRDRFRITPSLVHAIIDEILHRARIALYQPDPGAGLVVLGASTPEIVRSATERFVRSVLTCADYWPSEDADLLLSSIFALPYEGRAGRGSLLLAKPDDPNIEMLLTLQQPVNLRKTRAVRKLMEAGGAEVDLLVGDGKVYGLGR